MTRDMQRPHRYAEVSCSQCGQAFGSGNGGFSHCENHHPNRLVDIAVAQRFVAIRNTLHERQDADGDGDYCCYDGTRTSPEQLGWRFRQNHIFRLTVDCDGPQGLRGICKRELPDRILAGHYDTEIELTWHDAAAAEYWYRYEKVW